MTRAEEAQSRRGQYDWLAPCFVELAGTDGEHRARLRERLIEEHLPVAQHIARRFGNRGEPLSDLEQVATIGLINAVDRFDPTRGSDFLSFAVPTITGEIRRHFRDHGWSTRVPRRLKELHLTLSAAIAELSQRTGRAPTAGELARHLDLPLDEVIDGLNASNAYSTKSLDSLTEEHGDHAVAALGLAETSIALEHAEDMHALRPLLAELPERERTILALRFFANQTQTQIADRIGISQMHVSRILAQTLALLREKMAAD